MSITFDEIERLSQQESADLSHYYVGVEHLFLALTCLTNGLTERLFERLESNSRRLHDLMRDSLPYGDEARTWPGFRYTPRSRTVLARALMLYQRERMAPERALLVAILEEGDSAAVRLLEDNNLPAARLLAEIEVMAEATEPQRPPTEIESEPNLELEPEHRHVLQAMFKDYRRAKVEHVFRGGFSGSKVLLIRPIRVDFTFDARVVVKLDDPQVIAWEKKRYEKYVHNALQYQIARIEDEPILHERIGGLKYTFVRTGTDPLPISLAEYAAAHSPSEIAHFLRAKLYEGFRDGWWSQNHHLRFEVWQEYELLLPPALVIQAMPELRAAGRLLTAQSSAWSRVPGIKAGDFVTLDGMRVLKRRRRRPDEPLTLHLCLGADTEAVNQAGRVEVRGLDLSHVPYRRGEHMPTLVGQVVQTRHDILREQIAALEPDFNPEAEKIPFGRANPRDELPNPLYEYTPLLNSLAVGMASTIHGDLHAGNVLLGPGDEAWLIDFEWTREGHTLFDWATLEISLLIGYVLHTTGDDWDSLRRLMQLIAMLNDDPNLPLGQSSAEQALRPIAEIRRIVDDLITTAQPKNTHEILAEARQALWAGYHTALAFCALRGTSWQHVSLGARRLQFLLSALAMETTTRLKPIDFADRTTT